MVEKGGWFLMVTVMYAYKDTEKMTLDILEPLLNLSAVNHKLKVEGVYADGFEVPRGGWTELVNDIEREGITHVIIANFTKWDSEPSLLLRDVGGLVNAGVTFVVAQAPFINGGIIHDAGTVAQAMIVVESGQYYRDVKGLRIRAGQRVTDKNVGNTPYGMKNVNGTLVIAQDEMENVRHIMRAHLAGISAGDISRAMGPLFNYDKVYHVIQYWSDKAGWR